MKIGILQTGHAPDDLRPAYGDFFELFQRLLDGHGFSFARYDVVDMQFPATVTECDGWLVTGSKHGAYEDHPFIAPLEVFIRDAYAADVPMVGICFGHQIIAQALGGQVRKYDQGWAVGRQTYDWNGNPVSLNAWHQDQVTVRPPAAQVYGSNAFCENAALVYDKRIFTVQAHPEFDADFTDKLGTIRGEGVVPKDQLDTMRSNLSKPVDNAFLARQIAQFFKQRELS